MGDPFSVAGTAVGITSLGIQTCQILYNYYSQFKGCRDDIDNVLRQVEGLLGILESLRDLKSRIEIDNHAPSSQLHLALKACEDALAKLEEMADKCKPTQQPEGIQARLRDLKKRALWPYKKETLGEMQAVLGRFQDNLALAVQSAGLDVVLRKFENLHPALNALQGQTIRMEQTLCRNTDVLEVFRQDVTEVALIQQLHNTRIFHELSDLRNELSRQTAQVSSMANLLVCNNSSNRDPATVPPSLLVEAAQILEDVNPRFQSSLEAYNNGSHQIRTGSDIRNSCSVCCCRPKKKQSTKRSAWFTLSSEEIYQHKPCCSYFAHADYSRSMAAQFTVYSRLVGFGIQAGWQCSRRGGWNTIAPVLRYRAVVSRNSPVFKVLNHTTMSLPYDRGEFFQEKLREIVSATSISLSRAFGNDASPSDLDENGNGILYAALELTQLLIYRGCKDIDVICTLIDTCIAHGVPCDQEDADRLTPVGCWQRFKIFSGANHHRSILFNKVLLYLMRKLGCWSVFTWDEILNDYSLSFYSSIANLLMIEEVANGLDEDEPLLLAILRRSETDFRICLETVDAKIVVSSLGLSDHITALASWPDGLRIVTSSGLFSNSNILTGKIWTEALRNLNMESFEVLLGFGTQMTLDDWYKVVQIWSHDYDYVVHTNERARYGKVFYDIAKSLLQSNNNRSGSLDQKGPEDGVAEFLEMAPLYHTRHLSKLAAESAWAAGYRDLDSEQWGENHVDGDPSWYYGTPLWLISARTYTSLGKIGFNVKWLMDHGADAAWVHPVWLTTPVHNLARGLVAFPNHFRLPSDMSGLLTLENLDGCTCYCSKCGCNIVGCAVGKPIRRLRQVYHRQAIQPHLFALVDSDHNTAWMSSAILRVLTFEKLSLTHTCCYRIFDEIDEYFTRPTPEETEFIHDLERNDIDLLESLVTKFETRWATYSKPFVTFMNRVWKPRMKKIRDERRVDEDLYQTELCRIGVTLAEMVDEVNSDGDSNSDSDVGSESDWSDWPDESGVGDADGWYTTDEDSDGIQEAKKRRVMWLQKEM